MKKTNLLLTLLGLFGLAFMVSCEPEVADQSPFLTITTSGLDSGNEVFEDSTFTISVNAGENSDSKKKLEDLVIGKPGTDTTVVIDASTYAETFTYNAPADGQNDSYVFTLTDKAGEVSTQTVSVTGKANVIINPPVDLGVAVAFTMERCGANDPSAYGLTFDQVTGMNPNFSATIITGTADKMVLLTSSDWTSITTVDDLTLAVDNGTAVSDFSMPLGSTVDYVVATKDGSTYTLINFNNTAGPVACAGGSSQFTLFGDAKQ